MFVIMRLVLVAIYGLFDKFECFVFIGISLCVREIGILDVDVAIVINFYSGGTFLFPFLGVGK